MPSQRSPLGLERQFCIVDTSMRVFRQRGGPCYFISISQERPVEVSDWRKNVEAMSGMEGRKKMFDAAKGTAQ